MSRQFWIYAIECIPSGRVYIGKTCQSNPCFRWAEHIVNLRNRISTSPLLQREWNTHPDLCAWTFRVLDVAVGGWDAKHKEASLILDVDPDLRLNTQKTSTVSLARRRIAEDMLDANTTFRKIREATGLSVGMIHKIKVQRTLRIPADHVSA